MSTRSDVQGSFSVQSSGFKGKRSVQRSGFRVQGSGKEKRVQCSAFSVQVFRVQGSGFRCSGFRINAKSEKSKTAGACLMPTRFSKR
jgi:hypothetical protein